MDAMRRRTGRPTKVAEDRRAARLPAPRVTAAERVMVEAKAARAGLVVAEFMRRAALGQTVRERPRAASDQLLSELNRIGVNLNQMTARLHMTGELADELPVTLAQLRGLMDAIADGP